jgi:hypothetical protein
MASRDDVILAAYQWWLSKRPEWWTEEQHVAAPTKHCVTAEERKLALQVVCWLDELRRPGKH